LLLLHAKHAPPLRDTVWFDGYLWRPLWGWVTRRVNPKEHWLAQGPKVNARPPRFWDDWLRPYAMESDAARCPRENRWVCLQMTLPSPLVAVCEAALPVAR
jgi:hypothetical protein